MKKIITLTFVALLAMLGLKSQAAMYLVGEGFNGWVTTGSTVMTDDGEGIYSWSGTLTAGSSFAFFRDTENWGSQRGPARGDGSAPTGDWEETTSMGAWTLTTSGSYLIQYNYNTDQAKIALTEEPVFNPTRRRFAVTGDAFGGWNMPPSGAQMFSNNGDGTYTMEFEGATASGFKLSNIDINEDFTSSWSMFDAGVMGASNLAEGDNSLSSSFGTGNMQFPVNGNVTLTISDVTENSCTLNISYTGGTVPDKAYYLIGDFNGWNESAMIPFVEDEGAFTLNYTFGGEFKIKDENGNWWGGGVTLTSENPSVTLVDGGNLVLAQESDYTLAIEGGVLTVFGFPATAVNSLFAEKSVASVKYVNMTGVMSDTPSSGINIMVVTYQDGSRKAVKVVK
ncbi:MAG: hypothetical protein J5523_02880 [Muribaculaceae bacterium]|nr:hypothetical protein [Muribaculaceae bacterium]